LRAVFLACLLTCLLACCFLVGTISFSCNFLILFSGRHHYSLLVFWSAPYLFLATSLFCFLVGTTIHYLFSGRYHYSLTCFLVGTIIHLLVFWSAPLFTYLFSGRHHYSLTCFLVGTTIPYLFSGRHHYSLLVFWSAPLSIFLLIWILLSSFSWLYLVLVFLSIVFSCPCVLYFVGVLSIRLRFLSFCCICVIFDVFVSLVRLEWVLMIFWSLGFPCPLRGGPI
jgi:hypothetical protein